MRKLLFLACLSVALGACEGTTSEVALASECQAYATALRAVTLVKPKLSAKQVETVDAVKLINGPICHQAAQAGISGMDFDYAGASAIVVRSTRQLTAIEGSVP